MAHMNDPWVPVAEPLIGEREVDLVLECVRSGWVSSLGKYIPQFEEAFSRFCGACYGVATSNGTTALHLALVTLDIGPGDEVLVPDLTFVATANAVTYTGARPVFVDVDPLTWTIDPRALEARITPATRAVIPVHLYGHPADMEPIMEIARRRHLWVVEDAAEAHGARYRGRRVGALGDISCFSFYGNKVITTGEGGMILTDNAEWAQRAASLRDHGMSPNRRYWHAVIGYNYRMTNLQAALGVAQMERIDWFIARKRAQALAYNRLLAGVPGIGLPPEAEWAYNIYWMYSILVDAAQFGCDTEALGEKLRQHGIDTRPFFVPLHQLPPYARAESYPVSDRLAKRGLNLPSAPNLDEATIARICHTIRSIGDVLADQGSTSRA
jgi:perosamine synthetase